MLVGQVGVMGIAGGLAGPVKQRHIEQAVDDIAVVIPRPQSAPGLEELAFFLEAGAELVGGENGSLSAGLAASQLIGGHAGRAVQKAHVVVVHFDLMLDAVHKAVHQREGSLFKGLIAGALIAQPDFAGPKAAGPLVVLALGVDVVDTGVVLAVVGIQRQVPAHQRGGGVQGLFGLCLGQDRIGVGFQHKGPLSKTRAGHRAFRLVPRRIGCSFLLSA